MKSYQITLSLTDTDDITLSLENENNGIVRITSYGCEMSYQQFCEFADAVSEIRQKMEKQQAPSNTQ